MSLRFKKSAVANSIVFLIASVAIAQSAPPDQNFSANDLVRAVVANELKAQGVNHNRWMYRLDREERGKRITKEVVQSSEGSLERIVATDGHGLNVNDQREEAKRIENCQKPCGATENRTDEAKRRGAMPSIFQDDS